MEADVLVRWFHSILADMVGQVNDFCFEQITFGRLQFESMFAETVKHHTHSLQMLLWGF